MSKTSTLVFDIFSGFFVTFFVKCSKAWLWAFTHQPQEGAAHILNVLIISNDELLPNQNPLVRLCAGRCVCLRASHLVTPLLQPTSAGSRDALLRDLKDFTATTGETCHTQLPLTCWLQFMELTLSLALNRIMLIFCSGFWEFWKNVWIFPNVEKEKGGELLTVLIYESNLSCGSVL